MRKKLITLMLICTMLLLLLAGCGSREADSTVSYDGEYQIYYLDINKTKLVSRDYEVESKDVDDIIDELMLQLQTDTNSTKYVKPIPDAVSLKECILKDGLLTINFNPQYNDINGVEEVLVRSAIAKTMLQIEGVDKVTIYVANKPIVDSNGNVISAMTKESFLNEYDENNGILEAKDLNLYYASADGQSLVMEKKKTYVDSRMSIEDIILDYLRKEPDIKDARIAIPENVKINYSTISDGVCYITLDSTLQTESVDISNNVIIYSIVNSICDSADVKKVVIKVSNSNEGQNNLDISGEYATDKSFVIDTYEDIKDI